METAIGIDSLIQTQARLSYDTNTPFYNFYKSIGGNGTIVKWADSIVPFANKDYIHFNYKGARAVSKTIFKALINDYQKAVTLKKLNKPVITTAPVNAKVTGTNKQVAPKSPMIKPKAVKPTIKADSI